MFGVLLKFGNRKWIDRFAGGELYMRPLREFVENFEGDSLRADHFEGVSFLKQAEGAILRVKEAGEWIPVGTLGGAIRMHTVDALDANVFCMHFLTGDEGPVKIDPRNLAFGDTCAVIKDFGEFLRRLAAAPLPAGQTLKWDLVTYVEPETYTGQMGPYFKRRAFDYQREYRIALLPGTGECLCLQVGDLSDLIVVLSVDQISHLRIAKSGEPAALVSSVCTPSNGSNTGTPVRL